MAQTIYDIYKDGYKKCHNLEIDFNDKTIKELAYEVADEIILEKATNEIQLENKIVLSMAIRLKVEEFMIMELNGQLDLNSITKDQTRLLSEKYREIFDSKHDIHKILDRVNLMTPENIHVNTFMYEPLIDMSVNHLICLYKDVSRLK